MAKTTFVGHPLHPQLVAAPLGLFPFSFVMDLMHLKTRKQSYADAAYYSMTGAMGGALAAAAAGAVDYLAIPPKTETKRVANLHALLNVGMVGLYAGNLAMRSRRRGRRPTRACALLNLIGNAGLFISQWYGGQLVYEHGMRVKGVDPIAKTKALQLPGDAYVADKIARAEERLAPRAGITLGEAKK